MELATEYQQFYENPLYLITILFIIVLFLIIYNFKLIIKIIYDMSFDIYELEVKPFLQNSHSAAIVCKAIKRLQKNRKDDIIEKSRCRGAWEPKRTVNP